MRLSHSAPQLLLRIVVAHLKLGDDMIEDFVIKKSNLQHTSILRHAEPRDLAPGQLRLKLERFALSANNITYATFGESYEYWSFFPTSQELTKDWGKLPVWAMARVHQSSCAGIDVGERVFGFFPASTEYIAEVGNVRSGAWSEIAGHRANLPSFYNQYVRMGRSPFSSEADECVHIIMYPLFCTSLFACGFF